MNHRNERTRLIRALLVERWPLCFAPPGQPKPPLAIGVGERLAMALPEIGAPHIQRALADYTGGPTYLEQIVEGAARVGLDGPTGEIVTAAQAAHAQSRLAGLRHAWKKRDESRRPRPRVDACGDDATGD